MGAKTPTVSPETGASVLGLASVALAGPLGFVLTKFSRGRLAVGKKEETLEEALQSIAKERASKLNLS